jgi:Cd2+/Zn2+-exporting ATPase
MTTCARSRKVETTMTGCGCSHQENGPSDGGSKTLPAASADATIISIPSMDCASEESDIRRALADIPGIQSLNFQLSARTLSIVATSDALETAVKAIRQADTRQTWFRQEQAPCPNITVGGKFNVPLPH